MTPEQRRRLSAGLMAAQYDRPTPQDTTVVERAGLLPLGTYANGMTGLAFPGFLADPVAGFIREATNPVPYLNRSEDEKRQTVETGFDVAGAAMVGGLAAPKPSNTVGMFGGRLAKTADQTKLARAEELKAQGVPREQIWNETGWFEGVDGKWRFEIDDSKSKFPAPPGYSTLKEGLPIQEQLSHSPLFAAYPDFNPALKPASGLASGTYREADNLIEVRGVFPRNKYDNQKHYNRMTDAQLNTTLHEIQHGIQSRENFARGGAFDDDAYRNLAGEAEARTVEKRRKLTEDQRAARPPWLDYDVPEANQIVRFGSDGPQMSANGGRQGAAAGAALSGAGERPSLLDRTFSRFGKPAQQDPFANPDTGKPFTGSGWHGSPDNEFASGTVVDRADPNAYMSPHGPWISSNRDVASTYSRVDPEAPFFSGSNVMPMEARFKNPMIFDAHGRPGGEAYVAPGNVAWDTNDISAVAKQRGHDGLVVRNVRDELQGGGAASDVYHPLERGTVYSPLTGDLLYANGGRPGGAAGAALTAPNDPALNELLRQYGIDLPRQSWSNRMLPGDA